MLEEPSINKCSARPSSSEKLPAKFSVRRSEDMYVRLLKEYWRENPSNANRSSLPPMEKNTGSGDIIIPSFPKKKRSSASAWALPILLPKQRHRSAFPSLRQLSD